MEQIVLTIGLLLSMLLCAYASSLVVRLISETHKISNWLNVSQGKDITKAIEDLNRRLPGFIKLAKLLSLKTENERLIVLLIGCISCGINWIILTYTSIVELTILNLVFSLAITCFVLLWAYYLAQHRIINLRWAAKVILFYVCHETPNTFDTIEEKFNCYQHLVEAISNPPFEVS